MDDVARLIDESGVGARTQLERMTLSVRVLQQSRLAVDAGDAVAASLVVLLLLLATMSIRRRRQVTGRHVGARRHVAGTFRVHVVRTRRLVAAQLCTCADERA